MTKKLRAVRVAVEAVERRLMFSALNVLTHHGDATNDGLNSVETVLSPTNVNPTNFGKQFTNSVDGGDVIAQPLYMQDVNITTGTSPGVHSVVFVATEADGLYALDANTGTTLWHDNFTNTSDPTNLTATTGVTTILQADIAGNPDVGTQLGILSTPAIDPTAGTLYLNANTKEIVAGVKHFVQRLWAVSISNGVPRLAPTVIGDTIAPSGLTTTGPYTYVSGPIINGSGNNNPYNSGGQVVPPTYPDTDGWTAAPGGATGYVLAFNAIEQMQRTAMSLINGTVYLGFASHGDDGPYYGWVLGYNATTLTLNAAFNTAPNYEPSSVVGSSQPFWNLGGIWMSGSNISTDGTNLYVVTGNGAFNGTPSNFDTNGFPIDKDYGDSVIKLTPDASTVSAQNGNGWGLKVADYFTPSNQLQLNNLDLDLGSGGATLLPGNLLMVGGKESRIYLLNENNLGKFNYAYSSLPLTTDPAPYDRVVGEYANNGLNNSSKQIYSSATYWNGNVYMGIKGSPALEINLAAMAAGPVTPTTTSNSFGYPGETFVLSANGNTTGVAWAENPGGADLLAYNASSFSAPIYDSNTTSGDALGGSIHFHVPTEAQGMVYAGSRGGGLVGYGLKQSYLASNAAYFGAPTSLSSSMVSSTDAHLSWTSNSSLATEFRVDRSTDGTSWTTLSYLQGAVTSFDDQTVAPNTKYQYRVIGVSGVNLTPYSNTSVYTPQLNLSGQNIYLRLDANTTSLDIWTNATASGGTSQSIVLSQLPSVAVTATGASNSLTIDFTNGDPLPAGGLSFTGASTVSQLNIIGDAGSDTVSIGSSSLTVAGSFGSVPIAFSNVTAVNFIGGTGSNTLRQTAALSGNAAALFKNLNATDTINVSAGSLTIPMPATGTTPSVQLGTLQVNAGAHVALAAPSGAASRAVLVLGTLSLAGGSGNWQSQLDLAYNDLILHGGGLSTLNNQVAQAMSSGWTGNGVTSSVLPADSTHLTSLGVIVNNDGAGNLLYGSAAPLGFFDGLTPLSTDLLVRNAFVGDANLDGKVDGSDYSRVDTAYLADQGHPLSATGWYNGDFNFDNATDGSDYTLSDNAFNMQGPQAPVRVAFTTAPPTTTAGGTSTTLSVQLRDALGNVVSAPAGGISVLLGSTSAAGSFLSSGSTVTSLTIPAGSSLASFQYKDSIAGTPVITASVTGKFSASQIATINPPSSATQLAFSTAGLNQAVASSSGNITVVLEDALGNPVSAGTGGVSVQLTGGSSGAAFKNLANTAITSITIPAGSSSANFKYVDSVPGVNSITASALGLASAVQQEILTASLAGITFVNPAYTLIANASPGAIVIQLSDQAGNPIAAGAGGVLINLATSSSGGNFYNSQNAPVTSVTIPTGANSVTLAYRDTVVGSPMLQVSSTGLATISQLESVGALPTGTVAYYSFASPGGLLTDGSGSGNTLKVGAGTVAFNTASAPAGFTGVASFSNSGYLTTSSGLFPVNVPTGNSTYTIAAWIDINNANKNGIVGWGNWGATDQVNAFRTTQGDTAPDGAGLDNYWWGDDYIQSTGSLVNKWAYAAVTYNGTLRSIYLNGQLMGTFTSTNHDAAAASNFRIGSTNSGEYFGGSMADLLIANTALTQSQIQALYNGT